MDKRQIISLAISSGLVLTALVTSTILTPTGRRLTAELTGIDISSAETNNSE
jgi:hypothetical protein